MYSKHEINIIEQIDRWKRSRKRYIFKCVAQTIEFKKNKRPYRLELLRKILIKGNIITRL